MLTERRRIVLRAVVDHHVASAAPVGSSILAQRYVANVSAATIRNELGALETQALLYQPYTSAGRLPTQAGYRRVVDDILQRPVTTVQSSSSAAYPHQELHFALRKSSAANGSLLMAELFRAVVFHLAAATKNLALLTVPSKTANTSMDRTQKTPASRIASRPTRPSFLFYNGLANLLTQPEFSLPVPEREQKIKGFQRLVGMLENESKLVDILESCSHENRVVVSIGEENCASGLSDLSLITSRYSGGVIAAIGPTRMNYDQAISAVSTAAHTLDDILE